MVTREQALTAEDFHFNGCTLTVGKRGGQTLTVEAWRRNGRTQTWKRSPGKFRVPVKHGLYDYHEITEQNAADFHTAEECEKYRRTVTKS